MITIEKINKNWIVLQDGLPVKACAKKAVAKAWAIRYAAVLDFSWSIDGQDCTVL